MAQLIFIVTLALTISFFCSLWEASFLSVRTAELRARSRAGGSGAPSAARLLHLKTERLDESMSAILTLNTIAHTVGAAAAGAQAARIFGDAAVGVFSAVLTLLVLVLTEVIPKTLGHLYTSQLIPFVATSLGLIARSPLALLAITTRFLSRGHRPTPPSLREIETHIENANRLGTLSDASAELLRRGVQLENTVIGEIMRPRVHVPTLAWDTDVTRAKQKATEADFPWVLVSREQQRDDRWHCVDTRELPDEHPTEPARLFATEPLPMPETTPIHRAFLRWWADRRPVLLIFDERGDTVGLVTEKEIERYIFTEGPGSNETSEPPRHPATP